MDDSCRGCRNSNNGKRHSRGSPKRSSMMDIPRSSCKSASMSKPVEKLALRFCELPRHRTRKPLSSCGAETNYRRRFGWSLKMHREPHRWKFRSSDRLFGRATLEHTLSMRRKEQLLMFWKHSRGGKGFDPIDWMRNLVAIWGRSLLEPWRGTRESGIRFF